MRTRSPWRLLVRLVCYVVTVEPVDLDALNHYIDTQAAAGEASVLEASS